MFFESRLWERRVFTMSADKCVMFQCNFTGFAEDRLWECRIFSFKNARTSQKSRVFPFTFHLFLLLEALQGFERLWEVLEVFGRLWAALALRGFVRLWVVLKGFVMFWEALALEGFGKLLKSLGGLWEAVA